MEWIQIQDAASEGLILSSVLVYVLQLEFKVDAVVWQETRAPEPQ